MQDFVKKCEFEFGKIDYNNAGRKTHLVSLEMTLKVINNKPIFSATGEVWNSRHSDIVMGGQCIDDIYNEFKCQLENRKLYESIMTLWEKWHLNDMNAGCIHQRAEKWGDKLIDNSKPKTQDNMRVWKSYEEVKKEITKTCKECGSTKTETIGTGKMNDGLLGKPCKKCGYKYGTAWVYQPIDKKDLSEMCRIMNIDLTKMSQIVRLGSI